MMITVSVIMITYNHEKYIEEAINGVFMQECDFNVELIIADDNSPDTTETVVHDFIRGHQKESWVKYTRHTKNKGIMPNSIWALEQAKGKYIAFCEGDDYWTDPLKLQRQVDFLEANNDYSMVGHNASIIGEGINNKPIKFCQIRTSQDISMKTIVNKWQIPSASMVFRKKYIGSLPKWYTAIYSGDYSLSLLLRHWGKIYFFKELMSVYRYTASGATVTFEKDPQFVPNEQLKLLNFFNEETGHQYNRIIDLKKKSIKKNLRFALLRRKSLIRAFLVFPKLVATRVFNKLRIKQLNNTN